MLRLIRMQHFSVYTMGVSLLQNMHPEVSSVSRPMFIRGSFLFGHFYTVSALILAYLVARGIMFRLRGCNIFHSALWGCHPYKTCTLRDVRYTAPCLSGVTPYLLTFSLLHPQFCILSHPMYNVTPHKSATFFSQLYGSNNHIKHEPRGTIGIRPYVYKGFPFIWSLLHCVRPHFGIFNRPRYNVPPHKGATLLSRHCGSVTSRKHAH